MRFWWQRSNADVQSEVAQLRTEAFLGAQHATATAYIFEVRAKRLGRYLNLLTFVGVVVPLAIGGLVLSYGAKFGPLDWLIPVATAVGFVQLIYSAWSVVARWVDGYDHALRAVVTNRSLAHRYESLAKQPTADLSDLRCQLNVLKAIDALQEESDYRQGVTDAEKRMGMHALLRQYQKECVGCNQIPTTMTPTNCGVCGDYPSRWVKR